MKTVFVQCNSMHRSPSFANNMAMAPVGETEFAQGVAAMSMSGLYGPCEIAAGIVSTADLTLGAAIEPVLRAQMAAGRNFRGIRYLGGKAEEIPFADPKVKEACGVLAKLGLSLDCNGPETHPLDFSYVLRGLKGLAEACPDLVIICDHCGGAAGPRSFADPSQETEWRACITELASCPNVLAPYKISIHTNSTYKYRIYIIWSRYT